MRHAWTPKFQLSGATVHSLYCDLTREDNVSSDGFIGVKRKRQSTKKFFLSGIADSVSAQEILSYLEKRDIKPTYLSLFKSKRKGTVSEKLHVPADKSSIIENGSFWPEFVQCNRWQTKPILKEHTPESK